MTFKSTWEKADQQHQLPAGVPEKMIRLAYPDKKLISYEILTGGCANLNIKIKLEGDELPYILRIYLRDPVSAYREQMLGALLKPTLPVPLTHYIGDCEGYRYAITDFMPGITLRDLLLGSLPHDVGAIMYEVGVLLSKISIHIFTEAGFFDKNLKIMRPATDGDYLAYAQECLQNQIVLSQLTPETIAKINYFLDKYGHLFPGKDEKHLVHADFDPANILVDNVNGIWKVIGILDWEFSFSGSTLCDVANMLRYAHQMPSQFEEAFLNGLCDGGVILPEHWQITIRLLNLLSLLDCLVRSDPKNQPNQCADICKLIDYIVSLRWPMIVPNTY